MARKVFIVIAVAMFILTLSSCQKGVTQEEYDELKAQLDTVNGELSSYKESAAQAEKDFSDLKGKVASVKQYADIISALYNLFGPNSAGQNWEEITAMVNDTGNQELIDEWSKLQQANTIRTEVMGQIDQRVKDINDEALANAWQKFLSGGSPDEVLSAIEAVGDNEMMVLWDKLMNAPQTDPLKVLEVLVKGIVESSANL
ncbi:MAG: hypothetical protein M1371_00040 [Actinobacteria bacterium]|nr:hypothetical protein [Actinomycetota bacterium]